MNISTQEMPSKNKNNYYNLYLLEKERNDLLEKHIEDLKKKLE